MPRISVEIVYENTVEIDILLAKTADLSSIKGYQVRSVSIMMKITTTKVIIMVVIGHRQQFSCHWQFLVNY